MEYKKYMGGEDVELLALMTYAAATVNADV
jgi:hypothetical protein